MTDKATIPSITTAKRLPLIWFVPLTLLLLVSWLFYQQYAQQSLLIRITFPSALGIEPNKTLIKFKDIIIGHVETVSFSNDLSSIVVQARITQPKLKKYMTDKTQFWLVSPRVSLSGISGLNTLLTGVYIDGHLSEKGQAIKSFTGYTYKPETALNIKGVNVQLTSKAVDRISVGTVVYLNHKIIGWVRSIEWTEDFEKNKIQAFIKYPYNKFINKHYLFWIMNNIDVSLDSGHLNANLAPIEALLKGGIRLKVNKQRGDQHSVNSNMDFPLYHNKKEAIHAYNTQKFKQILRFTLFFKDNLSVTVGMPVRYLGIQVGQVIDSYLQMYPQSKEIKAPVIIEIYPDKIKNSTKYDHAKYIIEAIEKGGLRAQLKPLNLLTSTHYISLEVESQPLQVIKVVKDPLTGYPIFATTATNFSVLSKKSVVLFDQSTQLLEELRKTVKSARELTESIKEDPNQLIFGK